MIVPSACRREALGRDTHPIHQSTMDHHRLPRAAGAGRLACEHFSPEVFVVADKPCGFEETPFRVALTDRCGAQLPPFCRRAKARSMLRGCTEMPNRSWTLSAKAGARSVLSWARSWSRNVNSSSVSL